MMQISHNIYIVFPYVFYTFSFISIIKCTHIHTYGINEMCHFNLCEFIYTYTYGNIGFAIFIIENLNPYIYISNINLSVYKMPYIYTKILFKLSWEIKIEILKLHFEVNYIIL